VTLWRQVPVATEEEAIAAGAELGWDVVLKATAESLRQRLDLAHVWRNIDDESEMRDAWRSLTAIITEPAKAGFVVQKNAAPGVPVAVGGLEDPLFGPAISFAVSGPLTDLVGDRAYRIPPITAQDAAEMVRSIKAAPLLFGHRGSEPVDVPAVEDLVRRVAQLKNDLIQVCRLDLDLVHATAHGVDVLNASIRVQPVADPRSDWFVRRLNAHAAGPADGVRGA
jgi:acyl-CoA synthetase (NDP forming)